MSAPAQTLAAVPTQGTIRTFPVPAQLSQLASGLSNPWIRCFLLVVIGFLVRMPALQGLPVWDDDYLIGENPFIKSPLLMLEAFRHYLFPEVFSAHYRPLQNVSFALDYLIWNFDPYGYHLTNVLLHLGSGVLLYFLLCRLLADLKPLRTRDEPGRPLQESTTSICAFAVALLWVVHPVHSAAVDYISGRADSLAFLFAAGGWLLFDRGRSGSSRKARVGFYGAALLCGMLALCSREIAMVWLCLFLLHLFMFEKKRTRKAKLIALSCCLLLFGSYAALRQLPEHRTPPPQTQTSSAPVRAVLMLRALGDYGRLMIYPSTLYMERMILSPENYLNNRSWRNSVKSEYLSLFGALILAALVSGACWKGCGQPLRIFGALWFGLGYLPVSNLIELNANVAEHWLYLPSVGFLLFLAGCAVELPTAGRKVAVVLACVAVSLLSVRGYIRSTDWVTPKTFYQRTMNAGGSSTRVAVNLGVLYASNGEYAKAEAIFRRVLSLTPDYPLARNNLADVLYRQGKHDEGASIFSASKVAAPETRKDHAHTWMAALNLARIRHNEKQDDEALAILDQARIDYPSIWPVVRFQSEVLRKQSQFDAALSLITAFVDQNWWHHGARLALGQVLAEKGDTAAAMKAFRFASWLDVHDAEALSLVAMVHLRQNHLEQAFAAQKRAISRQPNEPRQYRLLSDILARMGRDEEAQTALAKIASLEHFARAQAAVN